MVLSDHRLPRPVFSGDLLAVVAGEETYYPRLKPKAGARGQRAPCGRHGGRRSSVPSTQPAATASAAGTTSPSTSSRREWRCATWAPSTRSTSTTIWRAAATSAARTVLTGKTPEWVIEEVLRSRAARPRRRRLPHRREVEVRRRVAGRPVNTSSATATRATPARSWTAHLEGDPHAVIEGMIIGAYAIGAHEGYIYVRAEYPMAVRRLTIAIAAGGGARLPRRRHLRQRLPSTWRSRRAPAPLSAARRRRSSPASRASAACRGRGRRSRP